MKNKYLNVILSLFSGYENSPRLHRIRGHSHWQLFLPLGPAMLQSIDSLQPATSGSSTLDIPCPKTNHNTSPVTYKLRSGIKKPIRSSTIGLLLGRSSVTIKEITICVGVIDAGHVGEIIIVISMQTVWNFEKGECIAHLLLLTLVMPGSSDQPRTRVFGSSKFMPPLIP